MFLITLALMSGQALQIVLTIAQGELQDDEDDRALRWKCRECECISIIQLLQCAAQTCAVLQQKIDGP